METMYSNIAMILKSIADPKRLQIVDMLSCGELCACEILQAFQITQPTLSYNMKLLVDAGVVNERREGKNIYYSLNQPVLQRLQRTLAHVCSEKEHCMCRQNTRGQHEC